MSEIQEYYYLTYTGIGLPLRLVTPLEAEDVENRNTYFVAREDGEGRVLHLRRMVYGEVEMVHDYRYRADGSLAEARITDADGDSRSIQCDAQGRPQAG